MRWSMNTDNNQYIYIFDNRAKQRQIISTDMDFNLSNKHADSIVNIHRTIYIIFFKLQMIIIRDKINFSRTKRAQTNVNVAN